MDTRKHISGTLRNALRSVTLFVGLVAPGAAAACVYTQVSMNGLTGCALTDQHRVHCWGLDDYA